MLAGVAQVLEYHVHGVQKDAHTSAPPLVVMEVTRRCRVSPNA